MRGNRNAKRRQVASTRAPNRSDPNTWVNGNGNRFEIRAARTSRVADAMPGDRFSATERLAGLARVPALDSAVGPRVGGSCSGRAVRSDDFRVPLVAEVLGRSKGRAGPLSSQRADDLVQDDKASSAHAGASSAPGLRVPTQQEVGKAASPAVLRQTAVVANE